MKVYQGDSIENVIRLLNGYENPRLIAGGTDFILSFKDNGIPELLIDISNIEELRRIVEKEDYIEIGAGVTFTQIVESELFEGKLYGFKKACRSVGSPQIRNRGTIGGNIVNCSAAADSIPPLICLDSTIVLKSSRGTRELKLEQYLQNYSEQKISNDELLTSIRFKKPIGTLNFAKLGLRKALAISRISIATLIELEEERTIKSLKVSSGSIGRYPMREIEVENYLKGKRLTQNTLDEAIKGLQESMDKRLEGRSTLAYKRTAVERVLTESLIEGMSALGEVVL